MIYLDHGATSPVAPQVLAAMLPYFSQNYGNASSLHSAGALAREAVEAARDIVAAALGVSPDEIYFTSGGTESNNLAIKGVALAAPPGKNLILCSAVEHHAVLDACSSLRSLGFEVQTMPVDAEGRVDLQKASEMLRPETLLVSLMHGNNEVGTLQPVKQLFSICREKGIVTHCDAVQSFGRISVNADVLQADLISISAHKFNGPKGSGALYIRKGTCLSPLISGGGQESGRRPGTINVPGVVGMGVAVELSMLGMPSESLRTEALRNILIEKVLYRVPGSRLCGSRFERLPNNAHFLFPGLEGETLALELDVAGIYASAGSACSAGSKEASHVLLAMGFPANLARGALRLTLGPENTQEEALFTAEQIAQAVDKLRVLMRKEI